MRPKKKIRRSKGPEIDAEIKSTLDSRKERLKELAANLEEEALEEYQLPDPDGLNLRQLIFIDAYIACLGNVPEATKIVKTHKSTFFRWMKEEAFITRLNQKKVEWEGLLQQKMLKMALSGNVTLLIFLSKFVNPFYDDEFRRRVLLNDMASSTYERYPIPNPEFLPPTIPERFIKDVDESIDRTIEGATV